MDFKPIVGAVGGAIVGIIVWVAVSVGTGYEVGWIAWGVGGAVGYGAHLMGSEGKPMGIACVIIALLAILSGRMLVNQWDLSKAIDESIDAEVNQSLFDELVADANAYAELASPDQIPQFMVDHKFGPVTSADMVTPTDVEDFLTYNLPELEAIRSGELGYTEWRESRARDIRDYVMSSVSPIEAAFDGLGPIHALFAFLAMGVAFRLGAGGAAD